MMAHLQFVRLCSKFAFIQVASNLQITKIYQQVFGFIYISLGPHASVCLHVTVLILNLLYHRHKVKINKLIKQININIHICTVQIF